MTFVLGLAFSILNAEAQDMPLQVVIKPETTTVRNGAEFSVAAKTINISQVNQKIQYWSCSYYDNWIVDSPFVQFKKWPCNSNGVIDDILKPGEIKEMELTLKIGVPAEEILLDQVTFRLGLKTRMDRLQAIDRPVVWSQQISVKVKEPLPQAERPLL